MNISEEIISQEYSIGEIVEINDIGKGISSEAKLIKTKYGKYVLRALRNREQGITEYVISQRLASFNISPLIKSTKIGSPYVEINGKHFNLQEYIEHEPFSFGNINFELLGQNVSLFHNRLKSENQIIEQIDRFKLKDAWSEICDSLIKQDDNFFKDINELVEYCLSRESIDTVYIHGDLGKWNLLLHKKQHLYIIDFGEVRKGNHYFDIAAVLTSTLDISFGESEVVKSIKDFQRGYIKNIDDFDWYELKDNIRLWMIRGIVTYLKHNQASNNSIEQCKRLLEKIRQFERLLLDNFI